MGFDSKKQLASVGNIATPPDIQSGLHKGNGLFRLPGDSHLYRCVPGRGWSGLTRAIWELTEVTADTNTIRFITGSHKAAYPIPEASQNPDSSLWETYECPPGFSLSFYGIYDADAGSRQRC